MIFQGSLGRRRGLEQLLEAARTGEFSLIIQGSGEIAEHLRAHKHSHVSLLAPCPNEDVTAWLAQHDFSFVFYEYDCLNSAHACSSKFYASVFAGTPVICNRLPAFEEFAAEYGGCVFLDSLAVEDIRGTIRSAWYPSRRYEVLRAEIRSARASLERTPRAQRLEAAFASLNHER